MKFKRIIEGINRKPSLSLFFEKLKKYANFSIIKIVIIFIIIILVVWFIGLRPPACFISFFDPFPVEGTMIDKLRNEYEINKKSYEIKINPNDENEIPTLTRRGQYRSYGYVFDENFLENISTPENGESVTINGEYFYKYSKMDSFINSFFEGFYESSIYNLCFYRDISKIQFCKYNISPPSCSEPLELTTPNSASFGWGNNPVEDINFKNELFKLSPTSTSRCFVVSNNKNYKISVDRVLGINWETHMEIKKHIIENNLKYNIEDYYPNIERKVQVCLEMTWYNKLAKIILSLLFIGGTFLMIKEIVSLIKK